MMELRAVALLQKLLGAVRAAEEARLAALLSQLEVSRARIAQLRAELCAAGTGVRLGAAELAAVDRWRARLEAKIRAEGRRADETALAAEALRPALARALGRESAAAELVERARRAARHQATRRADLAATPIAPGGAGSQPDLPVSSPSSGSASPAFETGSPGIA